MTHASNSTTRRQAMALGATSLIAGPAFAWAGRKIERLNVS